VVISWLFRVCFFPSELTWLCRYCAANAEAAEEQKEEKKAAVKVGLLVQAASLTATCSFCSPFNKNKVQAESSWTHSLQAPGFNPWTYELKPAQSLLFQIQLVPLHRGCEGEGEGAAQGGEGHRQARREGNQGWERLFLAGAGASLIAFVC
jgi:hypothetical protein